VFRVVRSSRAVGPDTIRYALRATPIKPDAQAHGLEATRDLDTSTLLDKIANRQAVPTPEATFEELWAQLRIDLDFRYD
jgi:hypothetical protein